MMNDTIAEWDRQQKAKIIEDYRQKRIEDLRSMISLLEVPKHEFRLAS